MRSINHTNVLLAIFGVVALALVSLASPVSSRPHFTSMDGINHQFYGTTSSGDAVSDGQHTLEFSIWDDEVVGLQLWSEVQTVVTSNGLGSVHLGTVTPIPLDVFGTRSSDTLKSYFLAVTLDGEVITPRVRFIPVPYAHVAERILGDVLTGPGQLVLSQTSLLGQGSDYAVTASVDPPMVSDTFVVSDPGVGILKGGFHAADIDSAYSGIFSIEGGNNTRVHMRVSNSGATHSVSNLGSSGEDGVRTTASSGTIQTEMVSLSLTGNTSTVLMGTSTSTENGELVVSNLGSSGQDGVRTTASNGTVQTEMVSLSLTGNSSTINLETSTSTQRAQLKVSNLGSSGEDGVSIDAGTGTVEVKLGIEHEDIGARLVASDDGTGAGLIVIDTGLNDSGLIDLRTSIAGGGRLRISNLGSSGEDGVSIVVGPPGPGLAPGSSLRIGGLSLQGRGILQASGSDSSTLDVFHDGGGGGGGGGGRIRVRANVTGGHLSVSNIGSSGDDGVSIDVGDGTADLMMRSPAARLALKDLSTGQTVETEILSMSLSSAEPLISITERDAAPTDLPILRFEYDANGRVVSNYRSTTSAPGDSAELHSSRLTFYDGLSRVIVEADNGGKVALKKLQSGQTVSTEIVSMSLVSSEPLISLRLPDALPTDLPLVEYVYDALDTRIIETRRSAAGEPGDSTQQSSTGLRIFSGNDDFLYDLGGIQFSDASGTAFSVSPGGDMQLRQNGLFATDLGTGVGVGGTFPGVKLFVDGDICATGIIGPCSDIRYKKNIETIEDPIEKISKLRGVAFDWKRDEFAERNFSDDRQLGLIAQEVREVLPEVVGQGDDGYYFVDYSRLTPVLIEAVKKQQAEIVTQNTQIQSLQKQIDELKGIVNKFVMVKQADKTLSMK